MSPDAACVAGFFSFAVNPSPRVCDSFKPSALFASLVDPSGTSLAFATVAAGAATPILVLAAGIVLAGNLASEDAPALFNIAASFLHVCALVGRFVFLPLLL
jgi:hypothetical protein